MGETVYSIGDLTSRAGALHPPHGILEQDRRFGAICSIRFDVSPFSTSTPEAGQTPSTP